MKPNASSSGAALAAPRETILLDCYLLIDDSDDFITEIRTIIRERGRHPEIG